MQAVGNQIVQRSPSFKVIYTTGEAFTNELIESIQGGKGKGRYTSNEFRNKFRKADVFLIDDIQFIAGKEATQDEFFHTFNTLYMAQKQIVITSDRPPREFKNIAERITSRFNSGIIADIQPPDYETRVAILRAKRDKSQDQMSNEVIDIIAERVSSNIRELEGAYLRVLTIATATGNEVTPDTVLGILGQTIKEDRRRPVSVNNILKAVCSYYSVKAVDIKGKRRTKEIVLPRQVAMYLIKQMTDTPYMTIGELLGGRDHTTIMHGVEKIEEDIKEMGKLRQDVINVKQILLSE
jgi:chromosomal replication initiator protein